MDGFLQLLRHVNIEAVSELTTANAVQLINTACKVRIYELADKIAIGEVKGDDGVGSTTSPEEVAIPKRDRWDFQLGDRVVVKYSPSDFHSIQKGTIGWNNRLANVHAQTGVITDMISSYDNGVQVHFPAIHSSALLYAGILEHAPAELETTVSAWKIGDLVTTKSDEKVLKIMQRELLDIPSRFIGKKGRVIAVTAHVVFVTYDGLTSWAVKPAALMRSEDQTPMRIAEREHPRGFNIGEKVSVIGSLKRLILNQKGKGGWTYDMSKLPGKQVIVTDINEDDTIDVKLEGSKSWRMNSDSVLKEVEASQIEVERDLEFMPNDKVKMRINGNIRRILDVKGIPLEFLEQLTATAVVEGVDGDLDVVIRYNCDQNISVDRTALTKASYAESEDFDKTQASVKALKIGDQVRLDAGHPRYVSAILEECRAENEIVTALTSSAQVVGFLESKRAVIEYKSGKRYKIKEKYLTMSHD